jgi:hypothetical protein
LKADHTWKKAFPYMDINSPGAALKKATPGLFFKNCTAQAVRGGKANRKS